MAETTSSGGGAPAADGQSLGHMYSENVNHSRTNFFVLLLAQLYCLITIESTQDAALLSNSLTQELPILQTSISIETFYILAPLILLIIFFHFQIHLKSFWVSAAGIARNDGRDMRWLVDTYPWFITSTLTRRFAGRHDEGFAGLFEYWAGLIFGWFSTSIILIMIWARFLTKHDWSISIYHAALVACALAGAVYFLRSVGDTEPNRPQAAGRGAGLRAFLRGSAVTLAFVLPFAALCYATWWLFEAQDRARCQAGVGAECSAIFDMKERLRFAGLDPSARLDGVDVSVRPEGWFPTPKADLERLASVRGANLRAEDLRYASASDALFVRADLRGAVLRFGRFSGAWFQGADMTDADLSFSDFTGAHFDHANLSDVRLDSADVSGASFLGARMVGGGATDLLATEASFKDVVAQGVRFERADLRKVDFTGGGCTLCRFAAVQLDGARFDNARLPGVGFEDVDASEASFAGAEMPQAFLRGLRGFKLRMTGVDLFQAVVEEARLDGVDLTDAILSEARLSRSSMKDSVLRRVDLRRARFETVDLSGADLSGALLYGASFRDVDLAFARFGDADLSGADLAGARNLADAQLARACGDASTKLPEGVSLKPCIAPATTPSL